MGTEDEQNSTRGSNVYSLDDYREKREDAPKSTISIGSPEARETIRKAQAFFKQRAEEAARAPLEKARPIVLFHVSYGRNAWNSTWITRYRKGTLLASKAEARKYVEDNRTQGSAYRMTALPGWFLDFGTSKFLVTEINTNRPFGRLTEPKFAEIGIERSSALEMLEPSSPIWSGLSPRHDSVIVQQTQRDIADFRSWGERTTGPHENWTPGKYKRTILGKDWFFSKVSGDATTLLDCSAFDSHVT